MKCAHCNDNWVGDQAHIMGICSRCRLRLEAIARLRGFSLTIPPTLSEDVHIIDDTQFWWWRGKWRASRKVTA